MIRTHASIGEALAWAMEVNIRLAEELRVILDFESEDDLIYIGLAIASLVALGGVYAFLASQILLTDNRERRRHRALIDEDRARELRIQAEMADLEVAVATSDLDSEIREFFSQETE